MIFMTQPARQCGKRTVLEMVRAAWQRHRDAAVAAKRLFDTYSDAPLPRVPGMDTVLRLAVRIDHGRTVEEAAAREYCYRWALALQSPLFGVPHTLGM